MIKLISADMTEYERVEIMDRILLDFSETTENVILSYDTNVLDTDNETYNTNNPYIICSDITNGNKVDLTTCNFVRIYDPKTKSLKTVIESHKDTCLNKDGNVFRSEKVDMCSTKQQILSEMT